MTLSKFELALVLAICLQGIAVAVGTIEGALGLSEISSAVTDSLIGGIFTCVGILVGRRLLQKEITRKLAEPEGAAQSIVAFLEPVSFFKYSQAEVNRGGKYSQSQFIGMTWAKVRRPSLPDISYELDATFGVIRVHALSRDLLDCTVAVRYRIGMHVSDAKTGQSHKESLWLDAGQANWFSVSKRANLSQVEDFDSRKLNKYLKNTTQNIHEGESKDLLLLYIIKSVRAGAEVTDYSKIVYLCTDIEEKPIGMIQTEPFVFSVELIVTANGYKITQQFDVMISSDDSIRIGTGIIRNGIV